MPFVAVAQRRLLPRNRSQQLVSPFSSVRRRRPNRPIGKRVGMRIPATAATTLAGPALVLRREWGDRGGGEMVARGRRKKAVVRPRAEEDADYLQWKSRIPLIYDWFTNHNLAWPSLSCRWGQQLEQKTYKNNQRLFFSERTDGTYPNTLVVANCEVVKPRVATAEHISMFDEESQSPYVKRIKTIVHPGEVNRIREFPQNSKIVATHTDSPEVFIWDVDAQPDCGDRLGDAECHPDLILKGHQSNAEYALAMCNSEPLVLSGGKDKLVVLWSINDHVSALLNSASTAYLGLLNGSLSYSHSKEATHLKVSCTPTVAPRAMFHGHEDTVEDVQFCPFSPQEFCSVGDDSCLILWDARVGTTPTLKVERAHDGDINCVDWNPLDVNLLLTGSADSSVKLYDRRYMTTGGIGSPVHTFQHHRAAVLCVQWCPDKSSVFGSAGEDNFLNIWDHAKVGASDEYSRPPGLFFQHAGHRDKVVDFHWCETEPWTIASVSDDCARVNGGGTLQLWRMSDFIYRPMEEVLAELETIKEQIYCYSTET